MEKDLRELEQFQSWCHDEDLRLRREADTDPELAALIADADSEYQRRYGVTWTNPKAAA